VNTHKNNIIPDSAKNNKTKGKEPYSTLNPETNSLSPSAKSKGGRFVSQIITIIQRINTTGNTIPTYEDTF
jgi:hypothetical protein